MKILLNMLLLTITGILSLNSYAQQQELPSASLDALEVPNEQSLHHVQTEWTNQNNKPLVLSDFAGQPLIIVMFYGKCTGTCPVLIQRTWNLYRQLDTHAKDHVQVLAVSFDYKNDTPQALKAYAKMEQLDIPGWNFVTADHTSIRELAMLLGVQYRERNDGHFEHSNLITVLDGEGRIAVRVSGLQESLDHAVAIINQTAGGAIP